MSNVIVFDKDFAFGVATSAYQIEGAYNEDGRGLSIWDVFANKTLKENGNIACDHYHRYKEDISLMKYLGYKHYRFSISWTRILPTGKIDKINQKGIDFYNNLIDGLLDAGIVPYITIYHWDFPNDLYKEYGGWANKQSIKDYYNFSTLCFKLFGDRVKIWITFNEPWCISVLGHATGEHAPGRKEEPGTEPYIVAHNILLAHAYTVKHYRENYQGEIGICLNTNWWESYSNEEEDISASRRALTFFFDWFAEPVFFGDYPLLMKKVLKDRLPQFTTKEKKLLKNSSDFLGINYYTVIYSGKPSAKNFLKNMFKSILNNSSNVDSSSHISDILKNKYHYFKDIGAIPLFKENKEFSDAGWIVEPFGIRKLLDYCQRKYHPPNGIFVFENGYASDDQKRIDYLADHISEMNKAIEENKVKIRGYFAWTFIDNFEWAYGYDLQFGLVAVNRNTMKRTPKKSSLWYSKLINPE